MSLPFFIARRYLFSKKKHIAINIISVIIFICFYKSVKDVITHNVKIYPCPIIKIIITAFL